MYLGHPVQNEDVGSLFHKRRKKAFSFLLQSLPPVMVFAFFCCTLRHENTQGASVDPPQVPGVLHFSVWEN